MRLPLALCALALTLASCTEPSPVPGPGEKQLLRQIQENPDARLLLCDSAGPACDQKRDSLLPFCLANPKCRLYTVRRSSHPWLWEQLRRKD